MSPSSARDRRRARDRARRRTKPRLRDRFFQAKVARAITAPSGLVAGSLVAGAFVSSGAHPLWCVLGGLAGWGVPVLRAMKDVPGLRKVSAPKTGNANAKPDEWALAVADAEDAVDRFLAAVERCEAGPTLERLRELEEDVLQSLDSVHQLAESGREAEAARRELDPAAMTKAARRGGRQAEDAAVSQRQLIAELLDVADDARTRLTVINGRLDEAVGRAIEILARGVTDRLAGPGAAEGGVAAEVAAELGRLSAALHEVDAHEHPHGPEVRDAARSAQNKGPRADRKRRGTTATG